MLYSAEMSGSAMSAEMGLPNFDWWDDEPAGNVSSSGNGLTNRILTVISQGISAFGRNPTTQTVQGTVPIYNNTATYNTNGQTQQYQQQQQYNANNNGGLGANAVNTATGGLDALAKSFGVSTSTLMLGVGLGAFLLLKSPPGKR